MMLVVMVILMEIFLPFLLGDEVLAELGSSFINAHGMPDYLCRASCGVWKFAPFHPSSLESGDTIY